jgi:hypothetical protein
VVDLKEIASYAVILIIVLIAAQHLNVVVSGSMEPAFYRGDIVMVQKASFLGIQEFNVNDIQKGDVVVYDAKWYNQPVIHRVIDIVNDTQEVIGRLLNSLNQSNPYDAYIARYQAVQQLPDKLKNSITVIDVMLTIINGLISAFSELDVAMEQLKKDKADLTGLRSTLSNLNNQIETAKRAATPRPVYRSSGGCYVATCVYGSYDCPEVWTLRRYRDYKLAKTWYGRAFIRLYYAVSPPIVKWFGKTKWFKKMWKGTLDRMVKNLENKGFENTPYNDKDWGK